MFSKMAKLNDYDKVTLIYEPTVQAKRQKSKLLTYLSILVLISIFLLGVNFFFHFLRFTQFILPSPIKYQENQVHSSLANQKIASNINKCPIIEFDHLVLSIVWIPSFCNYSPCKNNITMRNWNIHGLWPDYKNNSYPSFCCKDKEFDMKYLRPILPDLQTYWQDLKSNDYQNNIWSHEWNKHGTCMENDPRFKTVLDYFNMTLTLFKKYNIQQWLEQSDILPTIQPRKLKSILHAIESRLDNKHIKIECDQYVHKKENCDRSDLTNANSENCVLIASKTYKLLDSIDICLDKNTLKPIDCPTNQNKIRKNVCDKDIYYLRLRDDLQTL